MKAKLLMTMILIVLLTITKQKLIAQDLFKDDALAVEHPIAGDGIWVEKPNNDSTSHKYTFDNRTYKLYRTFIYEYLYKDQTGGLHKFLIADNNINRSNYKGLPIILKGKHYIAIKGVTTGLIDNPRNIWMHPPRQFTFKILQFSPFPFIQFDPKVKNWAWNVEMHAPYLDTRWIPVDYHPKVRYAYVRNKDEVIKTPLGPLKCSVSTGLGTFHIGNKVKTTRLKSYYHPKYGFVKLEYQNINGSKLDINLIETRNN